MAVSIFVKIPATPQSLPTERYYFRRPAEMVALFNRWGIKSFFDSGCGPRHWIANNQFAENNIDYYCGDINADNVKFCLATNPLLNICQHNATVDPFPDVDLIFSSDVLIHLSDTDRLLFFKNFLKSTAKYLLMTTDGPGSTVNTIGTNQQEGFPYSPVHWPSTPWNFSKELDYISNFPEVPVYGSGLALYNREQVQQVVDNYNNYK